VSLGLATTPAPALAAAPQASPQAAAVVPPPPAAPTELLCAVRTGDHTATLRVAPGADPLVAPSLNVNDRFVFRALALAPPVADQDPAQPAKVEQLTPGKQVAQVVVTVFDTESEDDPQPLAQVRWLDGLPAPLAAGEPWQPKLSGWQRVYSPHLGRELVWGCAVAPAGSTPEGWADVTATASAAGLARVMAPAARRPLDPGRAHRKVAAAPAPASAKGDARLEPGRSPIQLDAAPGPSLRLAWLGDVMLDDGPGKVIARGFDPFADVAALLRDADLRIANLECVVAEGGKALAKPWTFRAHPRVLPVLQRHVDVVSLANNHSGDFGPQAFSEMLDRLDQAGLPYFGGGRNLRQAHRARIIERDGLRIAFLGYNEMFPRRFEAGETRPGIAWSDEEQIVADITAARAQADIVIPYMHWGQEHSDKAHARQRTLARRMIAAGADAVVGTHPHVRQDSEVIDGKPVIYSLGNFVFDGFDDSPDATLGAILWMTVDRFGVRDWKLQNVRLDSLGRPRVVP
jgi:poly-gamma-glutamate synthesis protein (capsule biosynthesis protein)